MSDELDHLRQENARLKAYISSLENNKQSNNLHYTDDHSLIVPQFWDELDHGLSKEQVSRYSRQIVLPSFGVQAQARLCQGSVLIIGAGGLGSPAAIYLAAAGVGRIGIVDRDNVELSNLHRQIIHTEATVGTHKSDSAAAALKSLNSSIKIEVHKNGLTPENAVQLVEKYDVVVDASDNAPSRYLISDACCVAKKPLVSGAAIGTDGQLTVYCHGDDGPCYRCLFPSAPPPQNCARCVDAGVLGVVPGIVGTMQALEAIKILSGVGHPMSRKMLVMDSLTPRFHMVTLRSKSPSCLACGESAEIKADNLKDYDYVAFTGQAPNDGPPRPLELIQPCHRLTPAQLQSRLMGLEDGGALVSPPILVLDVRPPEQYAICHLPGAINTPWKVFSKHEDSIKRKIRGDAYEVDGDRGEETLMQGMVDVLVVCRRGNDSQRAVHRLHELGFTQAKDMIGGMEAWGKEIDATFPVY